MLIWNGQAIETLEKYIDKVLETWTGTQFFILAWPNWIWKTSHAQELIQKKLWWYMYSDCLFVQDYSPFIWKPHTIPVEIEKEDKRYIEFPDESLHENYWVRELNEWLLNSSFSWMKFLLIENIQRMSNSAINAFLKSAEEPLQNRFIIATVPHISMVIDTIRSRSITIPFSSLTNNEMQIFAKENNISFSDKNLEQIIIAMAMWRPWFLISLSNKIKENEAIENNLKQLTVWLKDRSIPAGSLIAPLKQLSEQWLLNDFLEWRIAYCSEIWDYDQSERRIQVKKYIQSNVNLDSSLLYGLLN